MAEKKDIRLKKTINRHLLFRDSSHTLPANRLRVYHSPWGRHLLFRGSSHTLPANKLRVYHLPKRKPAVRSALRILLLFEKNLLSLKDGTRAIFSFITRLCLQQNFRKKWAKQLTPVRRSSLFTPSKFRRTGRLQPRVLLGKQTRSYSTWP
jgi:hypothetical protein